MQSGIRSLASMNLAVRVVLGIFILTCVLTIFAQLVGIFAAGSAFTMSEYFALFLLATGGIQIIAFVAAVISIPLWVYRAHANLRDAGIEGLKFRPGWATASFFIPFVNLYVPFASTRQLFNRSHGESDWHADSSVGDVTSWASCNWGALVVFIAFAGYAAVDAIPGVHVLLPMGAWFGLGVFLYVLLAGSAFYFLQLTAKITAAQESGLHYGQSDVFA